jgi:hypothetical protein
MYVVYDVQTYKKLCLAAPRRTLKEEPLHKTYKSPIANGIIIS